jgi:hypothetical protein
LGPLLCAVVFVLVVSFLSNVSHFVGALYRLLATLQLTMLGLTPFNFGIVLIGQAVRATLAKAAIYLGAFGFGDLLIRNKNVRLIGRHSSSEAFHFVLFLTSLLPISPFDDFIDVGAGATSASLKLVSPVTLIAKML